MGRGPNFGERNSPDRPDSGLVNQCGLGVVSLMASERPFFAMLGLCLAAAGCGGSEPPPELSGLWSSGPAACSARVGVRFGADAIVVSYDRQEETLFARPRYQPMRGDDDVFRVRIEYDLPKLAGGAGASGARGVMVLARSETGGIAPVLHNLVDVRTGAARLRISDDPAVNALTLQPCGPSPWREDLRGFTGV